MSFSPIGFAPSALLKCSTSTRISPPPEQTLPSGTNASAGSPIPVVFGTMTILQTQILGIGARRDTTQVTS